MNVALTDVMPPWSLVTFAAIFGAMWGSFANVVIVRWPQGLSVVRPASHCFSCQAPIRFYDNLPILSFLILQGRCRHCRTRFSPRYAIVECAMALLSVGVLQITVLADPPTILFGLTEYVVWFTFVGALLTAGMIDLETYLLPDAITLPGIAIGVLANGLVLKTGWQEPIIGAIGGYALLSLVFVHGYRLLTGHQGMGEGDPKLVAMIGAFLGVKGGLFALCFGALQGLIIGSLLIVIRRRTGTEPEPPIDDDELDDEGNELQPDPRFRKAKVPFGPFLALGAIEYLFFGDALITLYLRGAAQLFGL